MINLTDLDINKVARVIIEQIGAKAFASMLVEKTHTLENDLVVLSFKIITNPKQITQITVSYDSSKDTYSICFLKD